MIWNMTFLNRHEMIISRLSWVIRSTKEAVVQGLDEVLFSQMILPFYYYGKMKNVNSISQVMLGVHFGTFPKAG